MAPPVADEESYSEPTAKQEKPPAEAVKAGVQVAIQPAEAVEAVVGVAVQEGVMVVGAVAAIERPDEVEPEVGDETVKFQKVRATGAEPDEEAQEDKDEDPEEEEEDEQSRREEAEHANDEETLMEEEESESEETYEDEEDEEPCEVVEESDGVDEEEPEETKGVEVGLIAKDCAKGLMHGSAADDLNGKIEGEHVKCCDKNKDETADVLNNGDDDAGNGNADMQKSELAGRLELLVDDLPKNCVEGDIAMLFSESERIKSIRIIRNSSTDKSKDIAFVCFASIEAADKALTETEKGVEVKGMKVRVSACQDNNSLFLGNICKSWKKDQVLTALNNIGIKECKLRLPSNCKGTSRGFAFLEFESHYYARAAFRRLMKPDAIFGIDRSVLVSFERKTTKPRAKRVYLEYVPLSWNEDKIKECCGEYGKILNVDLFQISKNMKNETFSFVEFSSSKSALACVEGINNANIVDGSFKLSACLARPKNGATSKGAVTSKNENNHTVKVCGNNNSLQKLPEGNKGKLISQPKEVVVKKNARSKLLKDNHINITTEGAAGAQQTSKPSEGERKLGKNKNTSENQRPLKKASYVDGSNLTYRSAALLQTSSPPKGKRKPDKDVNNYINERPLKKAHNNRNARRPNRTRGPGQHAGSQYSRTHYTLGESSRSKAYVSDLEPHAGYIPPANRVHTTQTYDQRRIRQGNVHPIDVHPSARETAPPRSTYSDYTSHAHYQTGYEFIYPPPPTSESYYPGRDPFIIRRGDY